MGLRYLSWPWVAGLLTLLSLILHARLLPQFASAVPADLGDPLLNTWIMWWNTQQLPFTDAYWNAPIFAPMPNAFAFSETLLGLTWLTTPLQWLGVPPLAAYNTMYVAQPVLNGLSAYWLCLTLTGRRDAALVGGLALAFAPYHASQVSHVQTRATFMMPVVLVGLHRFWQTGDRRWAVLMGAALAVNGFICGYFLLYFSVFLGLAIAWLMIARPDIRKAATVGLALAAAALALLPQILKYRAVQAALGLHRGINEMERNSADLSSVALGSPHLVLWPISTPPDRPEVAGYPGIAIAALLIAAAVVVFRDRRRTVPAARWRTVLSRTLAGLSGLVFLAGIVVFLRDRVSYKVFGIAIDLAILATLSSPRLAAVVRGGSVAALYAVGAVAATMLALGPVGRVFGHRFWYRPAYTWLMGLPSFESARVPALFSCVTIVCLAVLAAFAVVRFWPTVTRRSLVWTAVIAGAIVLDGWAKIAVAPAPAPLRAAITADLVVELPTRGWQQDTAAMYRAMTHGRPLVNGYSGYFTRDYSQLMYRLERNCVARLEHVRGGRSIDAVIWRADGSAPAVDDGLRRLWPNAVREETPEVIVYRHPRTPSKAEIDDKCP